MFYYKTMKSSKGLYYNVKVTSSYPINYYIKERKKEKVIKKDSNECLSFFQQLLML
jgi:hypothetical protein